MRSCGVGIIGEKNSFSDRENSGGKSGLMVRNFYQSHAVFGHCIVSFALSCHSNTGNSCQ